MLSYLAMDLNKAVYPGAGSQQDSYLRLFVWTLDQNKAIYLGTGSQKGNFFWLGTLSQH